jgi:hypothetical protein
METEMPLMIPKPYITPAGTKRRPENAELFTRQ